MKLLIPEYVWKNRCERMKKLIELNAPTCVIINEAILMVRSTGLWRTILIQEWKSFRTNLSYDLSEFWHQKILGKTDAEFEKIFDKEDI